MQVSLTGNLQLCTGSCPQISCNVKSFTRLQLKEYSWFSSDEDISKAATDISDLFLETYRRASDRDVSHVLLDGTVRADFAREVSTRFLSLDPAPTDPFLMSFVSEFFSFYKDLLWSRRLENDLKMTDHWRMRILDTTPFAIDANHSLHLGSVNFKDLPTGSNECILARFFDFPAEIRDLIYIEALVAPEGMLVQSFTPPPLLCSSKQLRKEGLTIFYKHNHFEITVQRSRSDKILVSSWRWLPSIDMRAWRNFLSMWNVFNGSGTDGLRFVERVTINYQLPPKGLRHCFRLSHTAIDEESINDTWDIVSNKIAKGGDDYGIDEDEEYETDSSVPGSSCYVVALNRGTVKWRSREETQRLLVDKVRESGAKGIWKYHPLSRLAQALWLCARDCPRAAENVNFTYEHFYLWVWQAVWNNDQSDWGPVAEDGLS